MNLLGRHVVWEKMSGKSNASMSRAHGSGTLIRLFLGEGMVIDGEEGFITSKIVKLEAFDDGVEVTTKNSKYFVGLKSNEI